MSGHNKWSKIKNKKAVTDAAKSKIFSKMAKLISTASRQVNGDTTSPILRTAIDKAREYNMPADNIERAVKKGSGSDAEALESITYEAYGPGGSALVIEALTANRNKAAQEIKFILSKHGFSLATPGSATWAFRKEQASNDWQPTTTLKLSEEDSAVLEKLIEELEDNDEVQDVYTNAE
ncbi:MAG: YebC/PmpR family DNA-binding transcriptional regulator [bacterium]|nr:YebC/PmpR family DNA-binding transcriptional regulator [bacterium]